MNKEPRPNAKMIIGRIGRYVGAAATFAHGTPVEIVGVIRDGRQLYFDHQIGELQPTDTVAFFPGRRRANGTIRWLWVFGNATPAEIEIDP